MKKLFISLIVFAFCSNVNAQSKLTTGARFLFNSCKSLLSIDEKNSIYKSLDFVLSGDAPQPFAMDKDSKEYPFTAIVYPTDLNKDGKEEIFIAFGNSYTSGNTGVSIVLFIKDLNGMYAKHFGFPGLTPDALTTLNQGYPDLLIGGPGLEFPVWRWNGKAYVFKKSIKDAEYEKLKKQSIEDLSKAYQLAIKN